MVETLAEHHSSGEGARPKRRRRGKIAALAAAVVLVTAGLAGCVEARHLDHQYGPIEQGYFGGLYFERNFVLSRDGFSYSLAPTAGAIGQLISSVDNRGSHSVIITSIDTDDIVANIRWSTYRVENGGSVDGVNTPWHEFPAVVPAHGTIRLLITIHHPTQCALRHPGTAYSYSGQHVVHWESLLHSHSTNIDDGLQERMIEVCPR